MKKNPNRKNKNIIFFLCLIIIGSLLTSCAKQTALEDSTQTSPSNTQVIEESPTEQPAIEPTSDTLAIDAQIEALIYDSQNYLNANQIDQAIESLNNALEIKPNEKRILIKRATIYFETLQFDEAVLDLNQILLTTPEDIQALHLRGNVYFSQDEKNKAIADFEKVIELDSSFLDAYIQLGFLYVNYEEYPQAIDIFNTYIDLVDDGEDKNYMIDFVSTLQSIIDSADEPTPESTTEAE